MTKKGKLVLLIPALWASLFDIAMTIMHQSSAYWNGDLTKRNEGNPLGALFMENHLGGLFVISSAWVVVIALAGYFLPRMLSKVFLLFCVIAHSVGASTWLFGRYGFWYVMALVLFNTILYCAIDYLVDTQKDFPETKTAL